jgi:hypothetical protein
MHKPWRVAVEQEEACCGVDQSVNITTCLFFYWKEMEITPWEYTIEDKKAK